MPQVGGNHWYHKRPTLSIFQSRTQGDKRFYLALRGCCIVVARAKKWRHIHTCTHTPDWRAREYQSRRSMCVAHETTKIFEAMKNSEWHRIVLFIIFELIGLRASDFFPSLVHELNPQVTTKVHIAAHMLTVSCKILCMLRALTLDTIHLDVAVVIAATCEKCETWTRQRRLDSVEVLLSSDSSQSKAQLAPET